MSELLKDSLDLTSGAGTTLKRSLARASSLINTPGVAQQSEEYGVVKGGTSYSWKRSLVRASSLRY